MNNSNPTFGSFRSENNPSERSVGWSGNLPGWSGPSERNRGYSAKSAQAAIVAERARIRAKLETERARSEALR